MPHKPTTEHEEHVPNTGSMLALYPENPEWLAHDHGDAPSELHCTIGYFGKADELAPETADYARVNLLSHAQSKYADGITAKISGAGILGKDQATVVFIESEGIQNLHDDVFAMLDIQGHQYAEQYPSYIPHVTIGYASDDPVRQEALFDHARNLVGSEIRFSACGFACADDLTKVSIGTEEAVDPHEVHAVAELLSSADTEWLARKKLTRKPALTAAVFKHINKKGVHGLNPRALLTQDIKKDSVWNPLLHPRGRDGRFIHTFGFVKWMDNLKWLRGEVISINPLNGLLTVKDSSGSTRQVNPKKAYAIAPQKAVLSLPSPSASEEMNAAKGWVKTGSQGGSNPGGVFKIVDAKLTRPKIPFSVVSELAERHDVEDKLTRGKGSDHVPTHALISTSDGRLIRRSDTSAYDIGTGAYLTADERNAVLTDPNKRFIGGEQQSAALVAKIAADAEKLAKHAAAPESSYYVKESKSASHAANEVLANRLYEAAGVPVASVLLGDTGKSVASKMLTSKVPLSEATPEQLSQIRRDFAIDAWLANWDVVGLVNDNIVIEDGIPTRIDAGGALMYRAMGDPKGSLFGHNVTEIDTLRNPSVNKTAAAVFGSVTDEELRDGAQRIAALHPAQIEATVLDAGLTHELAATLIARRADIIKQTGIEDPHKGSLLPGNDAEIETVSPHDLPLVDNGSAQLPDAPASAGDENIQELGTPEASTGDAVDNAVDNPAANTDVTPGAAPSTTAANASEVLPSIGHTNMSLGDGYTFDELIGPEGDLILDSLAGQPLYLHLPLYEETESPFPVIVGHLTKHIGAESVTLWHGSNDSLAATLYKNDPAFKTAQIFPIYSSPMSAVTETATPSYINGKVFYNGEIIGSYEANYDGDYVTTINPEWSATGKVAKFKSIGLVDAFKFISSVALPSSTPPVSKDESETANSVKAAVLGAADSATPEVSTTLKKSYGKLASGEDAVEGAWVESKKDGTVGQIVGAPKDQIKYAGYVYVVSEDGNKKLRSVKTLQAVTKPKNTDNAVAEELKTALDVIASEQVPDAAKPGTGPYDHLSTADGKIPAIGQHVKAGKPNSQVEGKIVKIYPSNKYVIIQDANGKKTTKTLSTTYVLADADADKNLAALPPDDQAIITAATPSPAAAKKATPKVQAAQGPKYPSTNGQTWVEPTQLERDEWLNSNPKRKLMKEGYVPRRGLLVRDGKGNRGIIIKALPHYGSNPNGIVMWDFDQKKLVTRAANTLHVDHQANFSDDNGDPLQVIGSVVFAEFKSLSFPSGSKLYFGDKGENGKKFSVEGSSYYVLKPNGTLVQIRGNDETGPSSHTLGSKHAQNYLPQLQPFAVINENAPGAAVITLKTPGHWRNGTYSGDKKGALVVTDDYDVYKYELEKTKAAKAAAALEAVDQLTEAKSLPAEMLQTDLPPEPNPLALETDTIGPELPTITGIKSDLKSYPPSIKQSNSASLADAAENAVAHKDSTDVGTAVHYGLADSDHIEDMLVRFQIVRSPDGSERLEARFRLVQEHAEDLADLLFDEPNVKKGAWKVKNEVKPSELVAGDAIAVRVGHNGKNKPGNLAGYGASSTKPKARVVKTEVIGVNDNGLDVYRVTFSTHSGEIGQMDLEEREAPSLAVFEYDHNALQSVNGPQDPPTLTPRAEAEGWRDLGYGGIPDASDAQSHIDATGARPDASPYVVGYAPHKNAHASRTVANTLGDGTVVRMVAAPSWISGNENGASRRSSFSGEVRISVPLDGDRQVDDDMLSSIGRALEAVGIDPDAQGPPSEEQIALLGVTKFVNTFVPKWAYGKHKITSMSDPQIKETLDHVNKILKPELGRDVTLDDIQVRTYDTGRVQYVLSPDVADAITRTQGTKHFIHGGSGKSAVNVFSGVFSGLQSTDERFSAGVMYKGNSSEEDIYNGAGDRVYVRASLTDAYTHDAGYVIHPNEINESLEVYAWNGDSWGKRRPENVHINLRGTSDFNEWMYKRKLEPEQLAYYVTHNAAERIEEIKKRGITHIKGRPIEDIIVPPNKVDFTTPEWKNRRKTAGFKQVSISELLTSIGVPQQFVPDTQKTTPDGMVGEVPLGTEGSTSTVGAF